MRGCDGMENVFYIGIGGAGCNMANRLARNGLQGEFVAVDSDAQHLSFMHKRIKKIVIGRKLLHGTGCAGNVELGEKCAKEDGKALAGVLGKAEVVVLCLGLGGGTGTGAAPFIADIAKKQGAFVLPVVYYPFKLEKKRQEKARAGLKRLQESCDAVILLDNNKLAKLVPNLPMNEAFAAVDEITAKAFGCLFECADRQAPEGISWQSLRAMLNGGALCTVAWGSGKGKEGVPIAAKEALKQSFADDDLVDAYSSIVMLCCGNDVRANDALRAISIMRKKMGHAEFCIVPKPKFAPDRLEICGIAIGVRAPIHGEQERLNRALIDAAAKGKAKEAEKLLKKGADIMWSEADGTTALHKATSHPEMVRMLIGKGATVDAVDDERAQPIHCASFRGHLESVKLLIDAGADCEARGPGGDSPLYLACCMGDYAKKSERKGLVKYLLGKGVKVDAPDDMQNTPLAIAVENSSYEIVEMLVKAGANVNAKNKLDMIPLHRAAARLREPEMSCDGGKEEWATATKIIRLLLEKGSDVNAKTSTGKTAKDLGKKAWERVQGDGHE